MRARMYGTRPATARLPAETLGLVSHEPPVICRFAQHTLGFGLYMASSASRSHSTALARNSSALVKVFGPARQKASAIK
jgi:hypothetical protein